MATITSTADLIPRGLAGYRKSIAAVVGLLGTVLAALQPLLPDGSDWARYVGIGIAVLGAVGVYLAKNDVEPVVVEDPPGLHEAPVDPVAGV